MSFGPYIKALRLGYHPLPSPQRGMMRMTPTPTGGAVCRFLPPDPSQVKDAAEGEHYAWWEKEEGRQLIQSSPVLRSIVRINQPFTVVLDYDGRQQ